MEEGGKTAAAAADRSGHTAEIARHDSAPPQIAVDSVSLPTARVSMPEHTDYHLISDHQLTLIVQPESGFIGNLGFTFLGGAFGLVLSLIGVVAKAFGPTSSALTPLDLWTVGLFAASALGAILCLVFYGIASYRNRGLATAIRKQKFRGAA